MGAAGRPPESAGEALRNPSSCVPFAPCPGFATYGATTAFPNSLTEALDVELAGSGVRVQALCPGLTHTEIFEDAGTDTSSLPKILWVEADDVAMASLDAVEGGPVLFVVGRRH